VLGMPCCQARRWAPMRPCVDACISPAQHRSRLHAHCPPHLLLSQGQAAGWAYLGSVLSSSRLMMIRMTWKEAAGKSTQCRLLQLRLPNVLATEKAWA